MHELLIIGTSIAERGLIFAIVIMGMYISSRILQFDDLTVEGSFGLGGALTAAALLAGINPIVATVAAMCVGGIAGAATALLHTKLQFNHLMSGIIVTTALFSVSLKIGGANMPLSGTTIFTYLPLHATVLLSIISLGLLYAIKWFLETEVGFVLRATGVNQQMVRMLGKNVHNYILLGLIVTNMFNALAGSLFVQYVGFFSIWNNIGVLIIALAGLILAETVSEQLGINIVIGSLLYQAIITTTFELQLDQDWNKMVTALLIIALIILKKQYSKPDLEQHHVIN